MQGVCEGYRLLIAEDTESTENEQSKEGLIAQNACAGAEILTPHTLFGMTKWRLMRARRAFVLADRLIRRSLQR